MVWPPSRQLGTPAPPIPLETRRFFLAMRWLMLVLYPVTALLLSSVRDPVAVWGVLVPFVAITVVLQWRLRRQLTWLDGWLWHLAFAGDVILNTVMVAIRGGLNSDMFLLYSFHIIQAGMVLGMWYALTTGILACLLYSGTLVMGLGEVDLHRIGSRCIILLVTGLVMTYLAFIQRRAAVAAVTDAKTRLPNFRHFQEALAAAAEDNRRRRQPLALAVLDVDNFKGLNSDIGHPLADKVLEGLADLLIQCKRKEDVLARYGGEEFVLLFPGTELDDAVVLAERLRSLVAGHGFRLPGAPAVFITVSIGIAAQRGPVDPDLLLIQADAALMDAKQTGKNRVCNYRLGPDRTAAPHPGGEFAVPGCTPAAG